MIMAAIYEFMFMHKTPIKVVVSEYLKVSDFFVESSQKGFLNAILDKVSKVSRVKNGWKRFLLPFMIIFGNLRFFNHN